MRIDAFNKISQLYPTDKMKKTAGTASGASRDSLEISRQGMDFQIAKEAVQAAPDIREERVAQLREQLASGTYSVTGEDIAETLVERYFDYKA